MTVDERPRGGKRWANSSSRNVIHPEEPVNQATVHPAPCPPWCDARWCCPQVRHQSAPVHIDTADARYDLRLVRWEIDDDCTPARQAPRLSLSVTHKSEIAEAPDEDIPLTVCTKLSPAEGRALIDAIEVLLRRADSSWAVTTGELGPGNRNG